MMQPEQSDWRFAMKQPKKQYRPIAGQTWYEKVLDWITREENCRWSAIWIWTYAAFLLLGVYISANLMNRPDIADLVLRVWFQIFPVVVIVAAINPLSGIGGLRAESNLQKAIKDYLAAHSHCTYDELVAYCMPIKIHLGIDPAIEKMLQCHELVWEDDYYRLPTDEDRKKWRGGWLAEYGVKISFEDLEKVFALDLKELGESIEIEFSLGEYDGLWVGKTENKTSGADVFWLSEAAGKRRDFTTFQEMSEVKLFDGKSLKSVWADVTLTSANDHDMISWPSEHLSR